MPCRDGGSARLLPGGKGTRVAAAIASGAAELNPA
jgi:hypothetical protein